MPLERGMDRVRVSERLVAQIWQHQLVEEAGMVTASDELVRVVYCGRESDDRGPDFRDAIVVIDGSEPIQGDVEIHVKSSDWRSHGHHQDPTYNRVILHVVMWHDSRMPTLLENEGMVPVLPLSQCLSGSLEEIVRGISSRSLYRIPCHDASQRLGDVVIGQVLDDAGEERFRSKAALFHRQLEEEEAGQVLYRGIMGALGYTRNKEPFQKLAGQLPVSLLRTLSSREKGCSVITLQALMLGAAGLLPSQRRGAITGDNDQFVADVEDLWRSSGVTRQMDETDWRFFRVRPLNFPPRRIAAASHLIARCGGDSLFERMLRVVRAASPGRECRDLEDEFIVITDGYWRYHFDFGVKGAAAPTLLGKGRAAEIVLNIVLPFFFAWSESNSQPRLKERVLALYRSYPRRGWNRVTRLMLHRTLDSSTKVVDSARRQQGLLDLHHRFCAEERCSQCPVGVG